ncbi:CCA tRNA nucleotidyltransferase [Pseudemcibacter aquimaris]|uniref:CCA tRNA nucleotidyltransferase n=1 Tax=Pseudemcibacter aquimaris TaxID=2857064 RepID=UPI0020128071|nr:CCA tRNA nucleotidyltransferase [Pseudemcibacter aquimaris]MCC3859594.1 CCA tRNA nucleotidyltransferase [Pseudemcibacter aquimaris]WDU59990.1 CCA tRNA nucleotidyltransferase [Pseudemcibacter aquimaris]
MIMQNAPLNIGTEKWLKMKELRQVMNALGSDDGHAKIVGGAVRDALFNIFWKKKRAIGDIDIASRLTPDVNMERLEKAGIKVIPTGIDHGTVTAVINKKHFEITTLRSDVSTDGRHAEVEFTDDWIEDAKRRDFTINAFYLDLDGTVYDPLGGFDDLKRAKIRFIGDAKKRIEEDALRILRLFRFSSEFDVGGVDEEGLLASVELKSMIRELSGERIWQELSKILLSKRVMQSIPVLAVVGLLDEILPGHVGYDKFLKYVKRAKKLDIHDAIGRLSLLLADSHDDIKDAVSHLRLSNKDRDRLLSFIADYPKHDLNAVTLRRMMYSFGKDVVIQNLLKRGSMDEKTLYYINEYHIPELPYSGKDLIAEGWNAGPELGMELKRREQLWIDADFVVTH